METPTREALSHYRINRVIRTSPVRLHWLCNEPTPYNNYLFAALSNSKAAELLVHFQKMKDPSHPWRAHHHMRFSWRLIGDGIDLKGIRLALSERKGFFVVGGWADIYLVITMLMRILCRLPFAIWIDSPRPGQRSPLKRYFRSRWLKFLFLKAKKILVTGDPCAQLLHEMGCPREKIVLFPYWVPIPPRSIIRKMSGTKYSEKRPIRFCALGRLEPLKRCDLVISAMRTLVTKLGSDCAKATIIGEGSERNHLERLASSFGIEKSIVFLGWQEHSAAMNLLKESDVFIHAADWEPYGVSVLEAMAHGKPVIASDMTMAARDRIKVGINGFLFKAGDAEELAGYMERFISDSTLIAKMGQAARSVAEQWPVSRAVEIVKQVVGSES